MNFAQCVTLEFGRPELVRQRLDEFYRMDSRPSLEPILENRRYVGYIQVDAAGLSPSLMSQSVLASIKSSGQINPVGGRANTLTKKLINGEQPLARRLEAAEELSSLLNQGIEGVEEGEQPARRWSPWGQMCPVSLHKGLTVKGSPEFAVEYNNYVYLLADEDALTQFTNDPKTYLYRTPGLPRQYRVAVVGSSQTGTSTQARLLSQQYGWKVIDMLDLLREQLGEQESPGLNTWPDHRRFRFSWEETEVLATGGVLPTSAMLRLLSYKLGLPSSPFEPVNGYVKPLSPKGSEHDDEEAVDEVEATTEPGVSAESTQAVEEARPVDSQVESDNPQLDAAETAVDLEATQVIPLSATEQSFEIQRPETPFHDVAPPPTPAGNFILTGFPFTQEQIDGLKQLGLELDAIIALNDETEGEALSAQGLGLEAPVAPVVAQANAEVALLESNYGPEKVFKVPYNKGIDDTFALIQKAVDPFSLQLDETNMVLPLREEPEPVFADDEEEEEVEEEEDEDEEAEKVIPPLPVGHGPLAKYCPVTWKADGWLVPGSKEHVVTIRGTPFVLCGEEEVEKFSLCPSRYVPKDEPTVPPPHVMVIGSRGAGVTTQLELLTMKYKLPTVDLETQFMLALKDARRKRGLRVKGESTPKAEGEEEEEEEETTAQASSTSDNQQTPVQPSLDPILATPQTQSQSPTPTPEAAAEPLATLPLPAVESPVASPPVQETAQQTQPPATVSDTAAPRVDSTPPRSVQAEPTEGDSEADMNAMLQMAGIDVDFIAALPADIRAEILSQQMGSLGLNRPPRSRPSGSSSRATPVTPARAAPESGVESTPSLFSTPTVSAAPTVAPGAPRIAPANPMTFNLGSELNLFSNLVVPGSASSNQSQSIESMSDSAFMSSIESALAAALSAVAPTGSSSSTAASAPAASSASGSASNQVSNSAPASSSTPTVSSRSNDMVTDSEGISQEFLDALPPDIRAEVLAQERLLNGRNASAAAAASSSSPSVSAHAQDMDNASFIATLSPELREEVLMTSSDEFLASLPPELVAEAMLMRERMMQQYSRRMPRVAQLSAQLGAPAQMAPMSVGPRAEAVAAVPEREQEEANVAPILQEHTVLMLIRLLYLATPVSRSLYHRVMLSLCANPTTRKQLLQFVLKVLHNKSVNKTLPQKAVQHESSTSSGAAVEVQSIQRDDRIPPPSLYGGQHVNSCPGGTSSADLVYSVSSSRAVDLLSSLARSNHRTVNWFLQPRDSQADTSPVQAESSSESPFDCRLSELLSLLRLPLFRSSSTHLDSLINLLSLLVHPLLSTAATAAAAASRSEPAPRVPVEPAASSSTSSTSSSAEAAATPATSVGPSLPVQQVESQSRLGEVSPAALRPLCEVLSLPTASEATVEKATDILVCLAAQSNNRKFLLHELSGLLTGLVEDVNTHLRRFLSADVSVEANEKESLADSWSLSSSEIKLLRVLKTIKQLSKESTEVAAAVLHTTTSLPRLWEVLSLCLSGLTSGVSEGSNAVPPVLARLLPVIEAFFIVHGFVDQTPPTPAPTTPSNSNIDNSSAFVRFCETHRKILNIFIRQNPNLLQQTFEPLTKIPRILEFDNKRSYFRSQLRARRGERHFDSIRLQVRRDNVFMDSFYQLRIRTAEEMKGRLGVQFQGEEGIDAGGLTREWFMILSRQIFNPDYALFRTAANGTTFQPNQFSHVNPEHLSFFKFVGRIIGKALYDGYMLDAYFTRSFYKHMLGIAVTYHDMEAIDPEYYKNLKWTLENDITDVVDLTFSVETEELGRQIVVDLKPNGRNIPVTENNKMEYVQLLCELKMTTAIKQQIDSFLEGFRELIPADLISLFDDRELELLISGLPDIDVEDLRNNTEYSNFTVDSPQIRWFWDVLRSYDQQDRAAFLQFVTGTSRVPLEGFKALQGMRGPQKFQIHKAFGSTARLPSAHTCFNQLDLPDYETATQLKERLTLAIREGYVGFGFG
eukprot:GILK01004053.1.p1 GENE.GILK01004053.1~~GILK01004053.1.p1  ORF type:complete len:1970 (+),score=455.64 GILK01004053.1:306-6215(+)